MAGKKLLQKPGATVTGGAAIVDLPELGGSQRLRVGGQGVWAADPGRRPCFSSDRRTGYC